MFHIASMTLSLHDLLNMTSSGVGGRGRQPLNIYILYYKLFIILNQYVVCISIL